MSARPAFFRFGQTEADSTAPMVQDDGHARVDTRREPVGDTELDMLLDPPHKPRSALLCLLIAVAVVALIAGSALWPWGIR